MKYWCFALQTNLLMIIQPASGQQKQKLASCKLHKH